MNVLVICGGDSNERQVSLRSGQAVAKALEASGHKAELFDPSSQNLTSAMATNYDIAFPIIHGQGGEDGQLQKQLENVGLPYVGSDVAASKLCFDKWQWREFVKKHGVSLADGALVNSEQFNNHLLTNAPFVLKPVDSGSSVDTIIVRQPDNPPTEQIKEVFGRHPKLLIEQLIEGIEITVGVVGNEAMPVIEIIPPESGEFDYENKYNGATQEICPPENIAPGVQTEAQKLATKIHQVCGCADLSRTDMIVTADNQLFVLEINTLPGMTDASLLPKAAAEAGMNMPELCDRLVQLALKRQTDDV